jgi:hypothetical protein
MINTKRCLRGRREEQKRPSIRRAYIVTSTHMLMIYIQSLILGKALELEARLRTDGNTHIVTGCSFLGNMKSIKIQFYAKINNERPHLP